MTTENGLISPQAMRRHIDVLFDRRHWLLDKIFDKQAAKLPVGFEEAEVKAIEVAMALMEAEWHNLVRIRHNLDNIELHYSHAVRAGVPPEKIRNMPEWELDTVKTGD